ncbi:hypothetical protein FR483_n018L [Paramecium bursaria Chlorella virus FR483]|uniref:Uncharacterized protein n018L n=1 Tax=Paramecium bursaria Chlorella virus FR483 TaxID=399781 RepID=A7J672_PBCVF|nr:hypothetical protein FR483_n018L [Paramecium bursaria Chlorella virus FR483]ABT15303.1 hypothetical protein FR483_n018L [Paramecium bursaria Chlorella virus FR483]
MFATLIPISYDLGQSYSSNDSAFSFMWTRDTLEPSIALILTPVGSKVIDTSCRISLRVSKRDLMTLPWTVRMWKRGLLSVEDIF